MSFRIIGTGQALPERIVTNDDISQLVDTSDEWITERTGIKTRRVVTWETMTDLSAVAAKDALKDAGIDAKELDLIIFSTMKGDYLSPSASCMLQREIGATCTCIDVNSACAGFVYALDVADAYIRSKKASKVLVVAIEIMSRLVDWTDRSHCIIFGDGGGAVVLEAAEDGMQGIQVVAQGDPSHVYVTTHHKDTPFSEKTWMEETVYMNGQEVYRYAVNIMTTLLRDLITSSGFKEEDITWVVPHQANLRILDAASRRMAIPASAFQSNLQKYGNMSSGSIPVLLDEMNKEGKLKEGDLIAFVAFGGGLSAGACLLKWHKKN